MHSEVPESSSGGKSGSGDGSDGHRSTAASSFGRRDVLGRGGFPVAAKNSSGNMTDVSAPLQTRITEINHEDPDKTDASPRDSDTIYPSWSNFLSLWIAQGIHPEPPQVWKKIIETDTLCSPSSPFTRTGANYLWVSFQLRCPPDVEQADQSYFYESVQRKPTETVIGYHNTKLQSLVKETRVSTDQRVGNGILKDGRLRYGHRSHGGLIVYSDGGLETFDDSLESVQLELKCTNTMRVKGSRNNRYCVCGTAGDICKKAALLRLLVPFPMVPPVWMT